MSENYSFNISHLISIPRAQQELRVLASLGLATQYTSQICENLRIQNSHGNPQYQMEVGVGCIIRAQGQWYRFEYILKRWGRGIHEVS